MVRSDANPLFGRLGLAPFPCLALIMASLLLGSCHSFSPSYSSGVASSEAIPEGYVSEKGTLCFDEDDDFATIYNYCPSCFLEDGIAHIYYCSNPASGVSGDHIAYREGRQIGGIWYWSPKSFVLDPGKEGEWDCSNVCDPSVIKGEFSYQGTLYPYLMTYLGCMSVDNSANSFGFAVALKPSGPWIKVKSCSPLYDFYASNPGYVYVPGSTPFIWGSGQSSLISVDKKGTVLLFYTGGSTSTYGQSAEKWDFSDLDHPKKLTAHAISNKGFLNINGNANDSITNAEFVYDEENERFFMLSDNHPFDAEQQPTNIPYSTQVSIVSDFGSLAMGDVFRNDNLFWTPYSRIDEAKTGFKRNHNTCFFRDPYGRLMDQHKVDIFYTMSLIGDDWKVIFTYRIHRYTLELI